MSDIIDETFSNVEMWDSIKAFHEKFGHQMPVFPIGLDSETSKFRIAFMDEELREYIHAETLEDKIDALVDLVVVAMGTAYMHGFDWPKHWNEVFAANMRKRRANSASESKRGSALDIVKPEGWKAPNHTQYLK